MKIYLGLIASAIALAACSSEPAAPAAAPASAASAASAEAAPASETSAPAAASETASAVSTESAPAADAAACEATVESNDEMKFNTSEITINQSCSEFKLTLKHVGKMPSAAMGHNIVISKSEDAAGVLADGASATAAKGFIKEGDARVIAATKLIGGGESDTISIDPKKFTAGGAYEFYCTFPGHSGLMKGTVKVN